MNARVIGAAFIVALLVGCAGSSDGSRNATAVVPARHTASTFRAINPVTPVIDTFPACVPGELTIYPDGEPAVVGSGSMTIAPGQTIEIHVGACNATAGDRVAAVFMQRSHPPSPAPDMSLFTQIYNGPNGDFYLVGGTASGWPQYAPYNYDELTITDVVTNALADFTVTLQQ